MHTFTIYRRDQGRPVELQAANKSPEAIRDAIQHYAEVAHSLSQMCFDHMDLSGIVLPDGCLVMGASFECAKLDGAQARAVSFSHAILTRTSFVGADMRMSMFDMAQAQYADFTGARLHHGSFHSANLRGAKFDQADCRAVSFNSAKADCATFVGADLMAANLDCTRLDAHSLQAAETPLEFTGYSRSFRGNPPLDWINSQPDAEHWHALWAAATGDA